MREREGEGGGRMGGGEWVPGARGACRAGLGWVAGRDGNPQRTRPLIAN
jgi:hypothetical protein